ncbi:MAG: sigma factor-like helix-turn-helix DNA-binding protein, partial [Pseudomonadota bacterium]
EQLHIIEDALWKMPKRRRDAFLMHRVEGLTLTETGRRLGVTRHAIIKHVARAADDIDRALNGENPGDG